MRRPVEEDEEYGEVRVGNHVLFGWIDDEPCDACGELRVYHEDFDTFFCPQCNEWLDHSCRDETCVYCEERPERPLAGEPSLPVDGDGRERSGWQGWAKTPEGSVLRKLATVPDPAAAEALEEVLDAAGLRVLLVRTGSGGTNLFVDADDGGFEEATRLVRSHGLGGWLVE